MYTRADHSKDLDLIQFNSNSSSKRQPVKWVKWSGNPASSWSLRTPDVLINEMLSPASNSKDALIPECPGYVAGFAKEEPIITSFR